MLDLLDSTSMLESSINLNKLIPKAVPVDLSRVSVPECAGILDPQRFLTRAKA